MIRSLILASLLVLGCSGGDEEPTTNNTTPNNTTPNNTTPNNTTPNNTTPNNNAQTERCTVGNESLSDGDACVCGDGAQGFVDCSTPGCDCSSTANNMSTSNGATNMDPLPSFPDCSNSCSCQSGCDHRCRIECVSECAGGQCNFELNAGGRITCRAGSTCDILCESGGCEVTCETGASCNLRCQPQAVFCDFVECDAREECGAREKACNSSC